MQAFDLRCSDCPAASRCILCEICSLPSAMQFGSVLFECLRKLCRFQFNHKSLALLSFSYGPSCGKDLMCFPGFMWSLLFYGFIITLHQTFVYSQKVYKYRIIFVKDSSWTGQCKCAIILILGTLKSALQGFWYCCSRMTLYKAIRFGVYTCTLAQSASAPCWYFFRQQGAV